MNQTQQKCYFCEAVFESELCLLPIQVSIALQNFGNSDYELAKIESLHETYGFNHLSRNFKFQQWYANDCPQDVEFITSDDFEVLNYQTTPDSTIHEESVISAIPQAEPASNVHLLSESNIRTFNRLNLEPHPTTTLMSPGLSSLSRTKPITSTKLDNELTQTELQIYCNPTSTNSKLQPESKASELNQRIVDHLSRDLALALIATKRMTERRETRYKTHDLTNSLMTDKASVNARPPTFKSSLSTRLDQPGALSKEITTTHSSYYSCFTPPENGTVEQSVCLPYFIHNHYTDPMFVQKDVTLILKSYSKMLTSTRLISVSDHIKIRNLATQIMLDKREPVAYTWFLHHLTVGTEIDIPRVYKAQGLHYDLCLPKGNEYRLILLNIMNVLNTRTNDLLYFDQNTDVQTMLQTSLFYVFHNHSKWFTTKQKVTDDMYNKLRLITNSTLQDKDWRVFRGIVNECFINLSTDKEFLKILEHHG